MGDWSGVVGLSRLDQPNHLYRQITRDQRIVVRIVLRYQQSTTLPSKHGGRDEMCCSKLIDGTSQDLRVL